MYDLLLKHILTSRKNLLRLQFAKKNIKNHKNLEITKSKGENIKVCAWNSSRKTLPFKACMVGTGDTEKLLQMWQKTVSVILSTYLEITQFIEPDEAEPVYLVEI